MDANHHHCHFFVVRRTIAHRSNGMAWVERCRCGRTVSVDCSFFGADRISPKIRKAWFDAEGNLERITGELDELDAEKGVRS